MLNNNHTPYKKQSHGFKTVANRNKVIIEITID